MVMVVPSMADFFSLALGWSSTGVLDFVVTLICAGFGLYCFFIYFFK